MLALLAVEPDMEAVRNIDRLTQQHEEALAHRCVPASPRAAVDLPGEDLALRASALHLEAAVLLEQRKAHQVATGDTALAIETSHSVARMRRRAAVMLLKAHECSPTATHLIRAQELVRRAGIDAGDNAPIVDSLTQLQGQLEARFAVAAIAAMPPQECPRCLTQPELPAKIVEVALPWAERLTTRFDVGYATGRLVRSEVVDVAAGRVHAGWTLGVAVLGRAKIGPRGIVQFGPSYTFWRALSRDGPAAPEERLGVSSAGSHSAAARLELASGLGRQYPQVVSVHFGLELGVQYVVFDKVRYAPPGEKYVNRIYSHLTGGALGGSAGVCLLSGSICASGRVGSVPGGWRSLVPTLGVTVGVDAFGVARALGARKQARSKK